MNVYRFPGYPVFVAEAARELGQPEQAQAAARCRALSALADLCAQASLAPAAAPEILRSAQAYRDQLHIASRAADLILQSVRNALAAGEKGAFTTNPVECPKQPPLKDRLSRTRSAS